MDAPICNAKIKAPVPEGIGVRGTGAVRAGNWTRARWCEGAKGRIQKQVNHLGVMPRESGASSNPETRISNDLLGVTGSPAFAGDDTY